VDAYLENVYGTGADLDSYKAYVNVVATANAYQQQYFDGLEYDDAAIREYEADCYGDYTGYTFAYKYLSSSDFLHNGTEDEDHDHSSHTDEEIQASLEKAKLTAESLLSASSVEEFDKMISELEIYAVAEGDEANAVVSAKVNDALLPSVLSAIQDWISAEDRKEGDTVVLPYVVENQDEDGNITESTDGYFAVFYQSRDEHLDYLANVRRLLVKFEGGTTGEDGTTLYSADEIAAAKAEAEALAEEWKQGEKTDASFAALVAEHSDETTVEGGLYEDITPVSDYEANFLAWATDSQRKAGDIEVIDAETGYAVMYYVGDSELTYRDLLITIDMKAEDYNAWVASLEEDVTVVNGNTKYMYRDYIAYSSGY